VTVEVAGQWTRIDQKQIAHALGHPAEQVRVIYRPSAARSAGARTCRCRSPLALAVWAGRWSTLRGVPSRPSGAARIDHRPWQAPRDEDHHSLGRETRRRADCGRVKVVADGGAYMYTSNKVLGNTTLNCTGPYEIPNVAVDTMAVYTNNLPGAAFRASRAAGSLCRREPDGQG